VDNLADWAGAGSEWQPPPARLDLTPPEIHVWRFALEAPDERRSYLWEILTEEERARARRFYFERHRRRFTIARGILRTVLGRYLDEPPGRIQFAYGIHGKPVLEGGGNLHFNLTHSGDAGLLALTRDQEIGVDLEQVRPRDHLEELARRFFTPPEVAALAALEPAERELAFFQCWTRKEAFIKAGGEGLARPLDSFCVSLGEPARLLSVDGDPAEAARWSLRSLTPWPGFVACITIRARELDLRCFDGFSELLV
jgi:4'-phosphopantetheinyl transferase